MDLIQKKTPSSKSSQDNIELESRQVSTWAHRAWFTTGCATVLISLAKSFSLIAAASHNYSHAWLNPLFAAVLGYLMADLASGIYHWAIDNYGNAKTPVFGSQIESFQIHHEQPWAFTKSQLAYKLYVQAAAVTAIISPVNLFSGDPVALGFVGTYAGCLLFSQQFHAWAHTPKGNLPAVVVALQDAGIILGRSEHVMHHRAPYNSNYCIVSGVWNRVLDKFKLLVALEVVLLKVVGVTPRSWTQPKSN